MSSIEQYKEEIADKYIKDFKKDLNFFEKMMVAPISKKMKEILKSDKKIDVNSLKDLEDLGFWRKVLGMKMGDKQLFDKLVNKTFDFLKEKQEKIIQAQTEGRLDELSNLVINGKLDNLEQRINSNDGVINNGSNGSGSTGNTSGGNTEGGDSEGGNGDNGNSGGSDDNGNKQGNDEGDKDKGPNSIVTGTAVGVGGAAAYYESISLAERKLGIKTMKTMPEGMNMAETKDMMNRLSAQMKEMVDGKGVKLNKAQKKVYEKSMRRFNEAAEAMDKETEEAFKAWEKMQDRLPSNLLTKGLKVDRGVLKAVENLPDEELAKIIGKDEKAIVKFFDGKGIKVSEDFARQLKITKNVSEIKGLTRILKNGTKLGNFLKGIKGMGAITVLFAGFDVWCYLESDKEADLAKKVNEVRGEILHDQAMTQLIIGAGSVIAEVLIIALTCMAGGSVAGPIGTVIGVAVGILAAAASLLVDNLYYDRKEFYAQNRYDFIGQKRTKIKQSIVQLFESDCLDMDEGMKESIKGDRGKDSDIDTMEDAWEALIYQEEIVVGGYYTLQGYYNSGESKKTYLNKLSEEEKQQFEIEEKQMEEIINTRMEYIKQYVKEDKNSQEYNEMKSALSKNQGLEYVEQLLADSKVYAYLKSDDEDPYIQNYKELDVKSYKEAYKEKLSNEYSEEFAMFEKLRKEDPKHLHEICEGVIASKISLESQFENINFGDAGDDVDDHCYTEQEIGIMKRNIDFVTKYNEYIGLGRPIEKELESVSFNYLDYNYIEQVLLDLNSINKRPVWSKEGAMNYMSGSEFDEGLTHIDSQVSNSIFQNIMYSIAREIHGYQGNNDMLDLVGFYTGDGDSTGVYFDESWMANIDWAKDRDLKKWTPWDNKKSEDWLLDNLSKKELCEKLFGKEVSMGTSPFGNTSVRLTESMELDSPIEAADDKLNIEYKKRVMAIIDREYAYRENKKDYEKKIVDFIKTNNEGQDGYLEIPESLALDAKRAGIGDVNKFLFRVENGQIYALSRGDMANTVLHFDDTSIKIKYESLNPLRNKLSDQENELISYVDAAEKKLEKLRGKQGQFLFWKEHEDDLDIPVELERAMSQKSIEWHDIKESVLYMQPNTAHDCLVQKSQEYYDFFNGMYLGLLNTVTNMNHFLGINSNDINDSAHFLYATQFVGSQMVSVKDGKLEINNAVNENIKKYLPELYESYKDKSTGKTVKELLMSEDENEKNLGQELAKKIYELCLEETVLTFDDSGNVDKISTLDFSDNDLKKVKDKMSTGLEGIGFTQTLDGFKSADPQPLDSEFSIRAVEKAEVDSHGEIDEMTKKIIATMNNVDWTHKRKTPKFKPNKEQKEEGAISGVLSSRGYSEKITVNMDESKNIKSVKVDGLGMTFDDPDEGFRVANLINWIKNNIDENPYGSDAPAPGTVRSTEYGDYMWENGELQRDITNYGHDVTILEEETLEDLYPTINKSSKFVDYINDFM